MEDLGTTATHRYVRVVVVPALWTLSQRVDSRIFQDLPVSAIVRKVLQSAGVYQGDGAAVIPGSLDALPQSEALLHARVAAVAAEAARDAGQDALSYGFYERTLQKDPGTLRRMGLAIPARVVVQARGGSRG